MTDLRVIGGGVAGAMVTRLARERGWIVEQWSDPARSPASLAALCVLRPSWHPATAAAVSWYQEREWLLPFQWASRTTFRQVAEPTHAPGWYAISPTRPLLEPDRQEAWVEDDSPVVTVLATGYAQTALGGTRRWGATLVGPAADFAGIRVHEQRPRHTLECVTANGETRYGSTVAKTFEDASDRLADMIVQGRNAGVSLPSMSDASIAFGVRLMPTTSETAGAISQLGPARWAIGRLGRLGYSLAPTLAAELLDRIES